jgi:hypothetical protein
MKEEILIKLSELYENELGRGPFPTSETHEVGRGQDFDRFHGCLIIYLADIAGIASHGKRLKKISPERKREFQRFAAQSFFAKYPEFHSMEKRIQISDVPALKRLMDSTEQARQMIVEALTEDETDKK